MIESLRPIGKLSKTFGTEGAIKYHISDELVDYVDQDNFVFLKIKGSYVPFLIQKMTDKYIKLEWVDSPEEAQQYVNAEMFLPPDQLPSLSEPTELPTFSQLKLYNAESTYLGVIEKVEEYASQVMLHVRRDEELFLIPFHEQIYISHDEDRLTLDVAEGLMDL